MLLHFLVYLIMCRHFKFQFESKALTHCAERMSLCVQPKCRVIRDVRAGDRSGPTVKSMSPQLNHQRNKTPAALRTVCLSSF